MPSISHQALALLLRDSPELALRFFQSAAGVSLPDGVRARLHTAQFTSLEPPEYSADAACLIEDATGSVLGALVLEAQLSISENKRSSWFVYTALLHRALLVRVTVLVFALTEEIARWCAEPYEYDHLGSVFRPLVIGPSMIPRITDVEQARAFPEMAVLSVAAHGQEPGAEAIGIPAFLACDTLDTERGARYADCVKGWLNEGARRALEEFMSLHGYEFQSEWAKKYADEGRKEGHKEGLREGHKEGRKEGHKEGRKEGRKEGLREGEEKLLIKLLGLKFGALPEAILQRIRDASDAQIERWAARVLVEQTLDAVFAD
jgi:hypothetical protein